MKPNMKKIFLSVISLAACFCASAQMMPDSTVQVVAYWAKGDKISYECKTTEYEIDEAGTKTVKSASSETRVFDVLDADENGYKLRLSYEDVFSPSKVPYLTDEQMKELNENMSLTFKTDEFGTDIEVIDDAEAFGSFEKMVDEICEGAWKENKALLKKATTKEQYFSSMKSMLCNKEYIHAALLADFSPMLMFHGARLDTSEVYTFPQSFLNLLNSGGSMEVETQFWVDEKLTDTTSVVLCSDAYIDSEKMAPVMKASLLNMMKSTLEGLGQEYNEAECLAAIEEQIESTKMETTFEEYTSEQIHLGTGWPICWYSTREVVMSTIQGEKKTVIEKSVELKRH